MNEILEQAWEDVMKYFYNPLLHKKPILSDVPTASFNFGNNQIEVGEKFIELMVDNDVSSLDALVGVLKHEVGHYVYRPHTIDRMLFLSHLAKDWWEDKYRAIVNYFFDAEINLRIMLEVNGGRELRACYRTMQNENIKKNEQLSSLLVALYQYQTEEDLGAGYITERYEMIKDDKDIPDDNVTFLAKKLQALLGVNYNVSNQEMVESSQLYQFGEIIKDLIPKSDAIIICGGSLHDLSDDQINDGLDDIARKFGKGRYEKVRDFVRDSLGRDVDSTPNKERAIAGTESSKIERYDKEIPYYERLARTYGLLIVKRPLITNTKESHPSEQREFNIGDPLHKWNRFSGGGRLLPGISKKRIDKPLSKKDRLYRVPDLFIALDTSGSMTHPSQGSYAVLASFILARNYHANGSKIGIMNFSCDSAFLFPTRELDDVYSLLCAYWGGGTVLDTEKIKKYFKQISEGKKGYYETSDEDYKRLMDRLSDKEKKEFEKKEMLNVKNPEFKETLESLDNVLITDGGIYNIEDVVNHLNSLANVTRNVIFVVGNEKDAQEWQSYDLLNTQIVYVKDEKDLAGLAIGRVKKLSPPKQQQSLYGR